MNSADVRASGKLVQLKNVITEEDLSPQIDGLVSEFTLDHAYHEGTAKVYLNGLRQQKGAGKDYIEALPNKIEFFYVPEIDDILLIDYVKK